MTQTLTKELVRISDDVLISAYRETGSVWKASKIVDMSGQQIHARLSRLGVINKMNYWTKDDDKILLEKYNKYKNDWRLDELANELGRTKQFICRQAKRLGLTNMFKPVPQKFKDNLSIKTAKRIARDGHPRGMLGKVHADKVKKRISSASRKAWANPKSKFNTEEFRQKQSDNMAKLQASGVMSNNYSRVKNGTVEIEGRVIFFRSSWEANIAAYLQFKKEHGLIKEWEFETDVFWFEAIKRGVRSYKPDFKITNNDGSQYFIEVKGWMDAKSKTKLKRMAKYHPNVKIEVLGSKEYYEIKKQSHLYKHWGKLDSVIHSPHKKTCSVIGCDEKNHCKSLCRSHFYMKYKK